MTMKVILIVAHGKNLEIGQDGDLPWRLPGDLARFKAMTMGHTLIMGRKTFDSIGRPLPGRKTLVLSKKSLSLDEALEQARSQGETKVFIAGGASVYKEALDKNKVDEMCITEVDALCPHADVYFPEYRKQLFWRLVSEEKFAADEKNPYSCILKTYVRAYN